MKREKLLKLCKIGRGNIFGRMNFNIHNPKYKTCDRFYYRELGFDGTMIKEIIPLKCKDRYEFMDISFEDLGLEDWKDKYIGSYKFKVTVSFKPALYCIKTSGDLEAQSKAVRGRIARERVKGFSNLKVITRNTFRPEKAIKIDNDTRIDTGEEHEFTIQLFLGKKDNKYTIDFVRNKDNINHIFVVKKGIGDKELMDNLEMNDIINNSLLRHSNVIKILMEVISRISEEYI